MHGESTLPKESLCSFHEPHANSMNTMLTKNSVGDDT